MAGIDFDRQAFVPAVEKSPRVGSNIIGAAILVAAIAIAGFIAYKLIPSFSATAAPQTADPASMAQMQQQLDLGRVHVLEQGDPVVGRHFFEQCRKVLLVESRHQRHLPRQTQEFEDLDTAAQSGVREDGPAFLVCQRFEIFGDDAGVEDLAEFLHRPRVIFDQHFPQFGEQQGIVHGGLFQ